MSWPTAGKWSPKNKIKNDGKGGQKNQKTNAEKNGVHKRKAGQSRQKYGPQHQPTAEQMAGHRGGEFIRMNFLLNHELILKAKTLQKGGSSVPVTGLEPVTSRV